MSYVHPYEAHPAILSQSEALGLWTVFKNNVHPLTHLLHLPTDGPRVEATILRPSDTADRIPRELLYAIYLAAVASSNSEKIKEATGVSKNILLDVYCKAVQDALLEVDQAEHANTSSLTAFTLYILAVRHNKSPFGIFSLSTVACELAQKLNLHRETSIQPFSTFEAELRRRLWWQIIMLHGQTSQLCGAGQEFEAIVWDTGRPRNVKDDELSSFMEGRPFAYPGITEMICPILQYEVFQWMRDYGVGYFARHDEQAKRDHRSVQTLISYSERFEQDLCKKYLGKTDDTILAHRLAQWIVRQQMNDIRRPIVHSAYWYSSPPGSSLSHDEVDMVWKINLEILEFDRHLFFDGMEGYRWHFGAYFPFEALILVLYELNKQVLHDETRYATTKPAWNHIDNLFANHPDLALNTSSLLTIAIGALAITTWSNMIKLPGVTEWMTTPKCILDLQACTNPPELHKLRLSGSMSPVSKKKDCLSCVDSTMQNWSFWRTLIEEELKRSKSEFSDT